MVNSKRHEQDGCLLILVLKKPAFILNIMLLKISNTESIIITFICKILMVRMRIILNYLHISDSF